MFLRLLCPGRCSRLRFTHQVWEKERDGLWGHSPFLFILLKMLRATSVPSQFSKKKGVKKLLQAPLPPRHQVGQVIKPHLLHLEMTLHAAYPWNSLSIASAGKGDKKPAQGAAAAAVTGEQALANPSGELFGRPKPRSWQPGADRAGTAGEAAPHPKFLGTAEPKPAGTPDLTPPVQTSSYWGNSTPDAEAAGWIQAEPT